MIKYRLLYLLFLTFMSQVIRAQPQEVCFGVGEQRTLLSLLKNHINPDDDKMGDVILSDLDTNKNYFENDINRLELDDGKTTVACFYEASPHSYNFFLIIHDGCVTILDEKRPLKLLSFLLEALNDPVLEDEMDNQLLLIQRVLEIIQENRAPHSR